MPITAGTGPPWSHEHLERIGRAPELELASLRPDGTLRPYVTMWVVRPGDELYVRSAGGPQRPWYRRAQASGTGRVRAGGVEAAVTFARAGDGVQGEIDAAYHAKYDRYGPEIVGSVVGDEAHRVTIRLVPRPDADPNATSAADGQRGRTEPRGQSRASVHALVGTATASGEVATTPADDLLSLPMLQPDQVTDTLHAYQLAKRANALRVRAEAVRWAKRGAPINTISPGNIITPLARDELTGPRGEGYRRMVESSSVGRAGTPDEVATLAALLMGADGAFITGSDVLMDGGVTASYFYGELAPPRDERASDAPH